MSLTLSSKQTWIIAISMIMILGAVITNVILNYNNNKAEEDERVLTASRQAIVIDYLNDMNTTLENTPITNK